MLTTGEELKVEALAEPGFVTLTVDYGPDLLMQRDATLRLRDRFKQAYEEAATPLVRDGKWPACLIDIKARTAGSSLVKAMYELYQRVSAGGGRVVCIGYPKDYLNSLTSVALTNLAGFDLAASKEEAISRFGQQS